MEQRERPERATIEDLEGLDDALDAMSLDGRADAGGVEYRGMIHPSPDELFEAYTGRVCDA